MLADSWFSSAENMKFTHESVKKYFIFALKSNRYVALGATKSVVPLSDQVWVFADYDFFAQIIMER